MNYWKKIQFFFFSKCIILIISEELSLPLQNSKLRKYLMLKGQEKY